MSFLRSCVQRAKGLPNVLFSILLIVNINYISNIEWVPIYKEISKNVWSIILEKA